MRRQAVNNPTKVDQSQASLTPGRSLMSSAEAPHKRYWAAWLAAQELTRAGADRVSLSALPDIQFLF